MSPIAREILDSMRGEPVTFADLTDAFIAVVCSVGLTFLAGWVAKEKYDEQEAERIAALPKRVIERPQPAPFIRCDTNARIEVARICSQRRRAI